MKTRAVKIGKHEALEIINSKLRLAVVTDMGPRIAWFGPANGENLLFWDEEERYHRGNWLLKGGHRVWITRPGADECEESYAEDNSSVSVSIRGGAVTFTGQCHPVFGIQRGFTIRPAGSNAVWVENFVINKSDMLWSGGVWALTCTDPGGGASYGIPLGDGSAWDSFPVLFFRRWGGGHTSLVNDPQLKWTEDMLIINPRGREAKRALFAPNGIIAMRAPRQKCSFLKVVKTVKAGNYPWGCNIAFYIGPKNFMVEMETMSQEMTLKPGERLVSTERWILGRLMGWDDMPTLAAGK